MLSLYHFSFSFHTPLKRFSFLLFEEFSKDIEKEYPWGQFGLRRIVDFHLWNDIFFITKGVISVQIYFLNFSGQEKIYFQFSYWSSFCYLKVLLSFWKHQYINFINIIKLQNIFLCRYIWCIRKFLSTGAWINWKQI